MTRALLLGFVLLATTTACGQKQFKSLCTDQVPPPAECNTPCDPAPGAPSACTPGFHCSAEGKCDTFCTPTGGECGAGYVCTDNGFCVSDGNGSGGPIIDAKDCPAVHFTAVRTVPTVQLLLDQSGSMNAAYGNTTRWEALKTALTDSPTAVVKKLAGSVAFGAALYSGPDTGACPVLTPSTFQPRVVNNFAAIQQLLDNNNPQQNTPTAASIDRVVADFVAHPAAQGSPPIIVLATDGLPDTCDDRNPPTPVKQEAANQTSVAAAQRAYAAGIKLFFLFIGNDTAGTHPQQMANAGLGRAPINPPEGDAKFYPATDPAQLTAAFNTIIGGVVSCDLTLTGPVNQTDGPNGIVTINNGTPLIYGTDWTLDANGLTIHLLKNACDTLQAATNPTVNATFPCGAIIF